MKKLFFILTCLFFSLQVYTQTDSVFILIKFSVERGAHNIAIPVINENFVNITYNIEKDSLLFEIKPTMRPLREHSLDSVEVWQLRPLKGKQRNYCQKIMLHNMTDIPFNYIVMKFKDIICILQRCNRDSNVFNMIQYQNGNYIYIKKEKGTYNKN